MNLEVAKEMVEALLADDGTSISTLGKYGDEVSILLYEELKNKSLPSGRVAVPVAFVEAVRALEDIWYGKEFANKTLNECMKVQNEVWNALRAMLDQIGKE